MAATVKDQNFALAAPYILITFSKKKDSQSCL